MSWCPPCGRTTSNAAKAAKSPSAASRVSELKAQFGTPLFVMSEDDFRARARTFKDAFDAAFADICGGVDVYYAGKAFLSHRGGPLG